MLEVVRDGLIEQQANYHDRNTKTMQALHHWSEKTGEYLSRSVIVIVAIDFLLIGGELLHLFPHTWEVFPRTPPWKRIDPGDR